MTTIVISRPRRDWAWLRAVKIRLDGQDVARLRPGATHAVEVAPGAHRIEARMDWVSARPLDIGAGEEERVEVECRFPPLLKAMVYGFIRPRDALLLRRVERPPLG